MRLEDIRSIIQGSSSADWHHIACWGAASGPSFHNKWERWSTLGGGELDK
ncbi:hypothetical protein GCM10017744_001380 [Streptomyces antimycoticus]|uniref:Uncharacterized protein n=1 Tax=Streptomyces antimycoticus TaxID=68175 RepID=A0A4D4KR70_9ACTN|nr:hypothetical protein [Streptomyces antimycoticus]GDY48948.1 hypothetical protein SANT12839_098300 [Streptomyces antimycoticus]